MIVLAMKILMMILAIFYDVFLKMFFDDVFDNFEICGWSEVPSIKFLSNSRENKSAWRLHLELVSKELNHLAAILYVYARSLSFMK